MWNYYGTLIFFFPFFSIEFERWMIGWMEKKESEGRKGKMVWKWRGEKVKDFGWVEKEDKDILVILNIICYLKEGKREYSDGTCLPRNVICLNEKEILLSTKSGQAQIIYGRD